MKKYLPSLLVFVIAMFVMAQGWAQAGSGFYISSDIGANFASGVEIAGASNDVASVCDEYLNPGLAGCGDTKIPENLITDWWNDFDRGQGILAGASVGYSFAAQNPNSPLGGLRVELEYFYRQSKYDETQTITRAGGTSLQKIKNRELETITDRVGSITSHNLFANLYYDFANSGRFTPYVGIGGGFGVTDMEYGSVWARTLNQQTLRDGFARPADMTQAQYDTYISNLAGSTTSGQATLSDTLWGFQVLFGVDYAITETMSLGLKGRYVMFDSFSDEFVWNPLRSHEPYVRRDRNTLIRGNINADDIQFFGISVNMKYHF